MNQPAHSCGDGIDYTIEEFDLSKVDQLIEKIGSTPDKTIPLLQAVQKEYSFVPKQAIERIAEITEIPAERLVGVTTFYSQFRLKPAGKHIIRVCIGTACHVKGAPGVIDALKRRLHIPEDDDTDPDQLFTVQGVACLGCCTLAPVVVIDDVTYGHIQPDSVDRMLRDFLINEASRKKQGKEKRIVDFDENTPEIRVGLISCCVAAGAAHVRDAMEQAVDELKVDARIKRVGCVGMCHHTPMVEIAKPGEQPILYSKVKPEDAKRIVRRHFKTGGVVARVSDALENLVDSLLTDEVWEPVARYSIDVRDEPVAAFLGKQKHIALEYLGQLDPTDIDEYTRRDGFSAIKDVFNDMSPEDVIQAAINSGLRGRGGGGFASGRKWNLVREAEGDDKYIILNGDEGDPGAFMDRMLLESYPYRVLEGMIIAAYAVGANQGYLYIREEYPLAVIRMREAIQHMEEAGLLGDNILDSGFSLHLTIMEGAGAFVCGEETALLASIQGERGMPRIRPPFPAQEGLWGKPTLVNNVETYANIPWIFRQGIDIYTALGTETSKGTKVFSLAGKVNRGGLIEVPMGVTINQVVNEIGGGVAEGRTFKAVQIGGPSGGCIPASLGDVAIDYETLNKLGAIMGSGGLVVLDDSDCMIDVARYFMGFTQEESCGKCTFCRVGTRRMLEILDRIIEGKGKKGDLETLEKLGNQIKSSSLCNLGKTAPNPVLSTLTHFREEYEAHIEGRCPAGKCTAFLKYEINDKCIGCTRCAQACPVEAIKMRPYQQHEIDQELCTKCDGCRQVCPVDAVEVN